MDPVTQGAIGAACAQLALHKKLKHDAWIVGALAGLAPDLDILIRSDSSPLMSILYHRHFTHALAFIPIGALIVTSVCLLFCKRMRKHWGLIYLAAFIGYATHGLLDACTSYGTVLFWPFSDKRVSWDLISIVDPFFTIPLVMGVAWTAVMDDFRGCTIGLALAACILGLNAFQHHRAHSLMSEQLNADARDIRTIPMLASSTVWRGFAKQQGEIILYEINTPYFASSKLSAQETLSLFTKQDLPEFVLRSKSLMRDFEIFCWFTDGFLHASSTNPLQLIDARYLVTVRPLLALWGIEFLANKKHIKKLRWVSQQ